MHVPQGWWIMFLPYCVFYLLTQGQELTIRQIALLGFRDLVLLRVKLNEILPQIQTNLPPSIVQMLLILQVGCDPFLFSPKCLA